MFSTLTCEHNRPREVLEVIWPHSIIHFLFWTCAFYKQWQAMGPSAINVMPDDFASQFTERKETVTLAISLLKQHDNSTFSIINYFLLICIIWWIGMQIIFRIFPTVLQVFGKNTHLGLWSHLIVLIYLIPSWLLEATTGFYSCFYVLIIFI